MIRTGFDQPTDGTPASGSDSADDAHESGANGGPAIDDAPKSIDGRHARSERSRAAMVDALLELLREGTLRPSSAQIAERAGVTQRTLFNQFGDMDSLISAVAERQTARVMSLLPDAGEGTLEQRVEQYCDGLERLLQDTMHVRWAVVTNPNPAWDGDAIVRMATALTRKLLARSFRPELIQMTDANKAEVLDALEIITDPVTWRLRRLQQGSTSTEARRVVERSMLALLRDALAMLPAT